jgi:hypothetical protein
MLFSFTWEGMRASDNHYLHLTSNLMFALGVSAMVCLVFARTLRTPGVAPRALALVITPLALLAVIVVISRTVLETKSYSAGLAGQSGYLLPGISAALVGAYLLGRRRTTVVAAYIAIAATGVSIAVGFRLPSQEGTNPLYVSAGLAVCCLTMLAAPLLARAGWLTRFLTFLGRRSLLFFFVHYLVILVMPALPYAPLAWIVCLAITVPLMLLLSLANPWLVRWHVSTTPFFWLALFVVELLPGLLHAPNMAQRGLMCAVGVLFALNHAQFRQCAMRLLRRP